MTESLALAPQNDIWTSKSAPNLSVFTLLTWTCASRHTSVHFFDMSTSKSAPNPSVLYTSDLETCFAPQRRALFRHLNFQRWSYVGVLCTFWLEMCFAPQRRAVFPHLNFWVVRAWCVLCIWLQNVFPATRRAIFSSLIWPDGSAPAALARLLFDPLEPQIIRKTKCFVNFLPFRAPASSFFRISPLWSFFSSSLLWLFPSVFHLSTLSGLWFLNFLRVFHAVCWYFESISSPWLAQWQCLMPRTRHAMVFKLQ